MSETIAIIKKKLQDFPDANFETTESAIYISPNDKNGFTVSLTDHGENEFTVAFDSWSEKFDEPEEAINCVAFGLSPDCRLKLNKKGSKVLKWTVETEENGKWKKVSTKGKSLIAFWKKTKVDYLQNQLIAIKKNREHRLILADDSC